VAELHVILGGDDLLLRGEGHARATRDTLVFRHAALVGDIDDEHLARPIGITNVTTPRLSRDDGECLTTW
jgi:hypothetical protein